MNTMQTVGQFSDKTNWLFRPILETKKTCPKHGITYVEKAYKHFTIGCPKCSEEKAKMQRKQEELAQLEKQKAQHNREKDKRFGVSHIPLRYREKTVCGYEAKNNQQLAVVERIKAYASEFKTKHSGRSLALLGNAGTGKTHLACAIANHVINNCNGFARFTSVSEINRLIRQAKSFESKHSESEIIEMLASYDLLIIDEVGVQSGTEAESRALFDVFNERYQEMKPTILISNLDIKGFIAAVGDRIVDRLKEDGGELLIFNWESYRGKSKTQRQPES